MKTASDKFIEDVIKGFQSNKGKGSVYCFNKTIIPKLVSKFITLFNNKHPEQKIFIVIDGYETRSSLTKQFEKDNIHQGTGYRITMLSRDYLRFKYPNYYTLTITIGLNEEKDLYAIDYLNNHTTFMCSIFTKNIMNNKFITDIRNLLPAINATVNENAIASERIYSPVEEHRIGVSLIDEDLDAYKKHTDYINTSISVLGSLDNITKCKYGDSYRNISSIQFRTELAISNGWSSELDTSIDFQRQIDDIYNPSNIYERACNFYNIAKLRRDLVTDNKQKLEEIVKICKNNQDKRILIVSKRGEFARVVTKYINDNFDKNVCGDYHDAIEDAIATDLNGNIILVKSGLKKGQPKIIGSKAQSTANMQHFNNKRINILSIKESSSNELKIAVDLIIFTSTLCVNVFKLKERFSNIDFDNNTTVIYRLYCGGTIEQNTMIKEQQSQLIKVIEEDANFMKIDEHSGDVLL